MGKNEADAEEGIDCDEEAMSEDVESPVYPS